GGLVVRGRWEGGGGAGRGGGLGGLGAPREGELYEPVVRYLLPRAAETKAAVVRLSLPEGSNTELFCRRFADAPVPVRAAPAEGPEPDAYLIRIADVSGEKVQWQ